MCKHVSPSAIELKGDEADPADIVTKALGELQASVETRFADLEKKGGDASKLTDRLDRIEARLNRPGMGGDTRNDDPSIERKAFANFIRRGVERMGADEAKALTVSNDASAGYLAPVEFGAELIKLLRIYSPIRQYARVVTIGAPQVQYPRRVGSTAASWVAETDDRTASGPTFEQVALTPFELATYVDISNQLLEDNAYNLEGELQQDLAESFAITEGAAFVGGTGTGQPKGLLAASGITELNTGVAADFPASDPADVLISMFHALKSAHAQNGVWLMNRNTLATVRKWKDGDGRYLVTDVGAGIANGQPTSLLGRPIVEAPDMPDVAANTYPIMFGDLQGYRIVDRVGLSMLRDPFTLATKGQVRVHARKRVGGDVTHPDRFVKLKVSA